MSSSKKLSCKGTLRQVFIRVTLRVEREIVGRHFVFSIYPHSKSAYADERQVDLKSPPAVESSSMLRRPRENPRSSYLAPLIYLCKKKLYLRFCFPTSGFLKQFKCEETDLPDEIQRLTWGCYPVTSSVMYLLDVSKSSYLQWFFLTGFRIRASKLFQLFKQHSLFFFNLFF